jgi:hypothetical protein
MGEIVEVRAGSSGGTEAEVRQFHNYPIHPFFVFVPDSPGTGLSIERGKTYQFEIWKVG